MLSDELAAHRVSQTGVEEVEMYGNELLMNNPSDQEIELRVRKKEKRADFSPKYCLTGNPSLGRPKPVNLSLVRESGRTAKNGFKWSTESAPERKRWAGRGASNCR